METVERGFYRITLWPVEDTPEYWGCVNPQAFTLHRDGQIVARNCATQRDAKETAVLASNEEPAQIDVPASRADLPREHRPGRK